MKPMIAMRRAAFNTYAGDVADSARTMRTSITAMAPAKTISDTICPILAAI
ncbi:Uncharacterised protein [Mycobacterium tuberculosis]|nr:Uncharacterised protein [Mycobacterium tuberculosis]